MERAFAELLKGYRLAAGLTQEALAERAGLGVRSIQALERGESRPLRYTLRRLADALALAEGERTLLMAVGAPTPRGSSAGVVATSAPLQPSPPQHNLPQALSSLIGREQEQLRVRDLLAEARLVTLTGSGGVGKTRLALAVAEQEVGSYPHGVWLVELAALAEPRLVPGAVAQALGVREKAGRSLLATLAGHLQDKQLLLVLDNCEHLVTACAGLAGALLRACPHLRLLATSREGLEVTGEHLYRVPSLSMPGSRRLPPVELVGSYEAVRLFVARAQARRREFALTEANAHAVAALCARLDGIPLAIELAAARVDSLGVEGIIARLDDRFRLLTGGARDALPRQQTLSAALDWSYDLLTASERLLLHHLSVFAGGWTLAAAEAVIGAGDGVERERLGGSEDSPSAPLGSSLDLRGRAHAGTWEILDLLASLVNKSLVQAEEAGGELRYGLLETVRQYGQERLAAGRAEAARDRHLAWCLAMAEEAEPALRGAEMGAWLARLDREHDNLRAALTWARRQGRWDLGLRLAGALWRFWSMRGYFGEGRGWLERLLAGGDGGSPSTRARALNAAGDLAGEQGDYEREVALQEEALALWRALGDRQGIAATLNRLAWVASLLGDFARAVALREECLALMRELADRWGCAYSLHHLAWVVGQHGDFARAMALQEEGLALWRALGDRWGIARSLGNLGRLTAWQGEYAQAAVLSGESLAFYRDMEDKPSIAATLNQLGWLAARQGEYARAATQLEESLALQRELGDRRGMARSLTYLGWVAARQGECERAVDRCRDGIRLSRDVGARDLVAEGLEGLAWLTEACGQAAQAARLGGAAEVLRETLGVLLLPALRPDHERAVRAMRTALGEVVFVPVWDEGRALRLEEAVTLALEGHTGGG